MTPEDNATAHVLLRFEQFRATDLFEALRFQTLMKSSPWSFQTKCRPAFSTKKAFATGDSVGFPLAIPARGVQASQFTVAANPIDEPIPKNRRAHDRVQSSAEIHHRLAMPVPNQLRAQRIRGDLE